MHPGETRKGQNQPLKATAEEKRPNRQVSPAPMSLSNSDGHDKVDKKMIDLNMKPQRTDHEQASNNQVTVSSHPCAWISSCTLYDILGIRAHFPSNGMVVKYCSRNYHNQLLSIPTTTQDFYLSFLNLSTGTVTLLC